MRPSFRRRVGRFPRSGSVLVLAGLTVALVAAPGADADVRGPAAQARDVAATRAYIEADYRLARVGRNNLPISRVAIKALVRRTVGECPLAGEGAYANHAANVIIEEVFATIVVVAYRSDDGAIRAAAAAFKRLRWSNGELTRRVHVLAVKLENLAALTPSNICGDVRAYAATGFAAVSESTADFLKRFEAANVEAEEVPQRLLTPYEGPRQVQLMRAIKRLEWPIAEFEAHAVEQLMAVERGLHLSV